MRRRERGRREGGTEREGKALVSRPSFVVRVGVRGLPIDLASLGYSDELTSLSGVLSSGSRLHRPLQTVDERSSSLSLVNGGRSFLSSLPSLGTQIGFVLGFTSLSSIQSRSFTDASSAFLFSLPAVAPFGNRLALSLLESGSTTVSLDLSGRISS